MNIIERVAELLGPIERSNAKSSASSAPNELDLIERAVRESDEASRSPETREYAAKPETHDVALQLKAKPRPAGLTKRPSRTLIVDRHRLQRQGMIVPDSKRTPMAECFRRIKRQILANAAKSKIGAPANLVLVTSARAGEGKTFCAINLAISIALEIDRTVLLVDADVAKPSVPQALGLKVEQGLMDVLLDRRIELADVLWNTDIGRLTILQAGTAHHHATELLASDAMRLLLLEMAERYHDRIVIFDSPPVLAASEASALASQMGQVVMVVEAGKTSDAVLKAALGVIESSNIAGLLLNKGERSGHDYDYGGYG